MSSQPSRARVWVVAFVVAGAFAASCAAAEVALMPVSEVKRGMRGKGLTVMRGTRPEEFRVEILGVLKDAWPKGDMILARLKGLRLEKTGIISGMSGSPVYIKGKLIGAVAFTWAYLKEPICGISPIHQMMDAMGPKARPNVELTRRAGWGGRMPAIPRFALSPDAPWIPRKAPAMAPRPITTPVFMSSYDPELLGELAPVFERFGMTPLQGGGGDASGAKPDLRPGGVMGVQLVGGDMSMVASGTVTWRSGEQALGFGHGMFRAGKCDLPMTGGFVHTVMPLSSLSFKMSGATAVVGRVVNDFAFAVVGRLGGKPRTVPMKVTIRNLTRGRQRVFSYQLARDRNWTGMLVGYVMASSLGRTEAAKDEFTATVRLRLNLKGKRPLTVRDVTFSSDLGRTLMAVGGLARLVLENPWENVELESVEAQVDLVEERRTAAIVGMRLSADAAHRGEDVSAYVRLRPFKSPRVVEKEMRFRVPKLANEGSMVEVTACDAHSSSQLSRRMAPGRYMPSSFAQAVELIEGLPSGDELALRVSKPGSGLTVEGAALPDLPESTLTIIADPMRTGPMLMRDDVVRRVRMPWALKGGARLHVRVKADAEP